MTSCIFRFAVAALLVVGAQGVAVKCRCDCQGTELTCGKDLKSNALQTFKNPCQMICQNCISSEKWVPVKSGECDKLSRTKRRPPPPSPALATTASPTLPRLISASKQPAAAAQKTALPDVPPPKALSTLLTKAAPSLPKSPNTPTSPQQQSQKVQVIGG